jgi:hypothetical protein
MRAAEEALPFFILHCVFFIFRSFLHARNPHPNPPPEYRERGLEAHPSAPLSGPVLSPKRSTFAPMRPSMET